MPEPHLSEPSARPPVSPLAMVAAGAVMISFAAPLVKMVTVAPSSSAFWRVMLGSVFLLLILLVRPRGNDRTRLHALGRTGWAGSTLVGLFFALDLWFWHRSINWVGPGIATLLANLQVLLMALVGVFWYRERLGPRLLAGLAAALAGLWFLVGHGWQNLEGQFQLGLLFGGLTAFCYAGYMLSLRRVQQHDGSGLDAFERMFQVSLMTAVFLLPVTLLEGHSLAIHSLRDVALLATLALACQVLGWVLISKGMPMLAASLIGFMLLLQPSLSLLWDWLFFGLDPSAAQWLGMGLVLLGIYFAGSPRRRSTVT